MLSADRRERCESCRTRGAPRCEGGARRRSFRAFPTRGGSLWQPSKNPRRRRRQADGVRVQRGGRGRRRAQRGARRDGRPLGWYRAHGRRRAAARPPSSPSAPAPPSATCASGLTRRPRAASSSTTPTTRRYTLPPEQAVALTDSESPAYLPGSSRSRSARSSTRRRSPTRRQSGAGIGWHEHHDHVFEGCERFFRPGYNANLVDRRGCRRSTASSRSSQRGATVADLGCGHGSSTILMAQAFPNSTFVGSDYHDGLDRDGARRAPREAGVSDRVRFEAVAAARRIRAATTTS